MADGGDRSLVGRPGPTSITIDRAELVLALLEQAAAPCQGTRLTMALQRGGIPTTLYQVGAALRYASALDLVDQRGEGQKAQWVATPAGALRGVSYRGRITKRMGQLAAGQLRVCPVCDAEHDEAEAATDGRKLRGRTDHCAEHGPTKRSSGPALVSLGKAASPLKAQDRRMLGFLAHHPWRYGVEDSQRQSAERLHARGYLESRTVRYDGEERLRVPLVLVKATWLGAIVAESLGLVCPGRESGECEECKMSIDNRGVEG